MPAVLHVLPHRGGGGERYIDLLEPMEGYTHDRTWLSASRDALPGIPSILIRWPMVARSARHHDLLHFHGDMAAMLGLPLLRRQPTVVTTHGLSFLRRSTGLPHRLAVSRWRNVAIAARKVICSSQAERDELLEITPAGGADRMTILANGIELSEPATDEARDRARRELGLEPDDVACLYLGALDRYKDPLTAVQAARLATQRGASVKLLLAGDGPLAGEVQAQADQAVRPLGFRPDPVPLLIASDVFVMPSRREGGSYALLEAMERSLAVVAADSPGIPEMLGDAGRLVGAGDVEGFAAALQDLAADPALRRELGQRARVRVAQHFERRQAVERVRGVYEAVLAQDDPSGRQYTPRLSLSDSQKLRR